MSITPIFAKNLTDSDISIRDLSIENGVIEANSTKEITNYNRVCDILENKRIMELIDTDQLTLVVDGIELNKEQCDFLVCKVRPFFVAAPDTATSPGRTGDMAYEAGYFYICADTDVWVRWTVETSW